MAHLDDPTLHDYLDSALDPGRRADVERHLAACRACAARLDRARALFASLDSLPDLPLERDLVPDVLAAIRASGPAPRPAHARPLAPRLRLLFAAQALLAFALLAAAVPLAIRSLPLAGLSELSSGAAAALSDVYASTLSAWNAALLEAGRLFARPAALPDLPLPPLPAFALVLILMAAGLLWLVGNGVLLKQIADSRGRSAFGQK